MGYFQEKIISASIGRKIPVEHSITSEIIDDDDVAGAWKGVYRESVENLVETDGTNPVYFKIGNRRKTQGFYRYDGSNWVSIPATSAIIFGAANVWLGKVHGATGSESVNTPAAAGEWLEDNTYDSTKTYFFYDILDNRVKKVTAFTAATVTEDTTLYLTKGQLDKVYINRAVTFADETSNINDISVRLAGENEEVIGSILGLSYGKLKIAVEGWDIKFINGTSTPLTVGKRIIGSENSAVHPTIPKGFIQEAPDPTDTYDESNANIRRKGRGFVVSPGGENAGASIVKAAMIFGQ